ncbi:hypothetical protein [Streptomyces parvus]|uniref:Alpha/beta hydrolase n=1 Tax=Streptomyces parvus TaxID=66428 RepID=A0A7K3RYA1_9ACTN|nr:hypothetical protein [Streptomyces parvus]NEC19682.1 hypothetical protein [Streptomyces parvus]
MAAVVVIHGIGKQYLGELTLHRGIAPALLDGLSRAGHHTLTAKDIRVAFYGHCFRNPSGTTPKGGQAALRGGAEAGRFQTEGRFETELLLAWWQEAARLEPDRVPAPLKGAKAPVPVTAQRVLRALSRSRFLTRAGDRFLLGVLRQVRSYLGEREVRERVQAEIAAAVEPDTRVIVGHSLGSVVAYEALCAHPEWPVRTLVTVGSPLGIPRLVFDRLTPGPVGGRGTWPGGIHRWTNICDRYDVVALAKELAPLFTGGPATVDDVLVDNGWQAHTVEHHLTAEQTGRAIAIGLTG